MSSLVRLVGEQIRAIRKEKGITQEELGESSGLSFSFISDVERGTRNISLETLEKIILALNTGPSEIFNFKNTEIETETDKIVVIEILRAILMERRIEEVKFIEKLTKDFIKTVDNTRDKQ